MLNYENFTKEIRNSASLNNRPNKVITPKVSNCIFCTMPTKLEIKKVPFDTSPIIFSNYGIG